MHTIKKIKTSIYFVLSVLLVFLIYESPCMAHSIDYESKTTVKVDFELKKCAGIEVYELLDENGTFMGYYEPYSDANPQPAPDRYGSSIDWTIGAGLYKYGVNQYTLSSGITMDINISQSITGTSYLTFQNRTTNSSLRFTNTMVTNGWNGTITFSGISTAVYSFGIENASSSTIRYVGTYSL